MPSVDHAFKVAGHSCSDGAEINMNKHEYGQDET
jgi:hypothetical protein